MAPRNITPGVPFAEAIIDAIKEAKVFILVHNQNSNSSSQVVKEVDRAVHHGLAIIPLRLEDVPMTKQLEYYVSDVHWLDALTPPLERHINRLGNVVQMLLSMDKADKDDIKETIRAGIDEQAEPYLLAGQAEAILGNDPRLAELFSKISLNVDVITDPPGANVFIKEYGKPDDEWKILGVSPLEKARVPVGIFRWKLEKEGYVTVLGAASSWEASLCLPLSAILEAADR